MEEAAELANYLPLSSDFAFLDFIELYRVCSGGGSDWQGPMSFQLNEESERLEIPTPHPGPGGA